MLIFGERFRKAVEKGLHCRRIGVRHHQRKRVVCTRLNGCEDVGEGEAPVAEPRRALAAPPPDMADAALLADARFVLKKQTNALAFMTPTD